MKVRILTLLLAAILSVAGCSQQTELDEAKKRIAQLESELAAERATRSNSVNKNTGSSPSESQSSAQPNEKILQPVINGAIMPVKIK